MQNATFPLSLEKETLRTLSGPELTMHTGLQPLAPEALEQIHGGGVFGEIIDWVNDNASVLSAVVSAAASAVSGASVGGVTVAVSGSGLTSVGVVVSAAATAAGGLATSAVTSAQSSISE